eukprot:Lithocolla_globosa_v1_NODE_7898_length_889_cov_2.611511.p1 type:complete len:268 gc:universal NODE_7898_length_889_cov_2.611511:66-869(+)
MSSSGSTYHRGIKEARKAVALDENKQHKEALQSYTTSIELLISATKHDTKNSSRNKKTLEGVKALLARAEQLKSLLKKENNQQQQQQKDNNNDKTMKNLHHEEPKVSKERQKIRAMLKDVVLSEKPDVEWSQVAGLAAAKLSLEQTIVFPKKFPQLYTGKRKPWKGILLYGPPGTGKTYIAKAVASLADSTFFYVSSSDLVSKWMGESERLVKELFLMAQEHKPSIIFIDEVDALASRRSDDQNEATRRITVQFALTSTLDLLQVGW